MGLGDLLKTKKYKEREEERQRQEDERLIQKTRILEMEAKQRRDKIILERARIDHELEQVRLHRELAATQAENNRKQQMLEDQAESARQARREQEAKDFKERQDMLAARKEEQRQIDLRKRRAQRRAMTEPENLRALRDQVRRKYQLDIDIWAERGVRKPDRPLVQKKMDEADDLLTEIINTIKMWEAQEGMFNAEEWKYAQQVKTRLLQDGIRRWADKAPWNED